MAPENHNEVQTNANWPEKFPQICNKPVKCDTREGSFPLFDSRDVVVDTCRLVCLLGLKSFVDPVFGAIVIVANISTLPARFPAHQYFVLSRTLFKRVVRSVHEAKSRFFECFVACATIQFGVTSGTNAIEHFNIALRNFRSKLGQRNGCVHRFGCQHTRNRRRTNERKAGDVVQQMFVLVPSFVHQPLRKGKIPTPK